MRPHAYLSNWLWLKEGGAYAVVDGRVGQPDGGSVQTDGQPDGARIEAVGRERKRRPVRVGEDVALARAAGAQEVGHARQRLHVGAGGGRVADTLAVGAVHEPHVVADNGNVGGGARGRDDHLQAPHVQRFRECAVDADERRAWGLFA